MYLSYEERASKAFDSPNDVANWLTFGVHGTIREAFSPEDAWSAEHWSNIIGTIGIIQGTRSFFKPKPALEEAQMLKDIGLTNKQLGPAVAGAYDRTIGKIYTAINNVDGKIPEN